MKNKTGRRSFLKNIGVGGVSAAILPASILTQNAMGAPIPHVTNAIGKGKKAGRGYNGIYTDEFLRRVAFPIGGLGTGMFCIEGTGAISHMSLRSKPDVFNEPGMFGAIAVKGIKNGAKVIEGPVPDWKSFGAPLTGNGAGGSIFGSTTIRESIISFTISFQYDLTGRGGLPPDSRNKGMEPFYPHGCR